MAGEAAIRRVRSDVILRRFLAGWTFDDLWYRMGCRTDDIERAIRNALNRKRSKAGKR